MNLVPENMIIGQIGRVRGKPCLLIASRDPGSACACALKRFGAHKSGSKENLANGKKTK